MNAKDLTLFETALHYGIEAGLDDIKSQKVRNDAVKIELIETQVMKAVREVFEFQQEKNQVIN